jgi:uncharacterized membrane protein YedE/YeeE|tara:strand:- start:467 stop:877 length:411 start_codon:yes stop_codon:yes gene_type:complete
MNSIFALISGVLFGAGLLISGMMDPAKVIGFLDLFGAWDPSLAFVMGSALLITVPAFRFIFKQSKPMLADGFILPLKQSVDKPLLLGSAIFGIGWGLYGYCPGPAISSLANLNLAGFIFIPSMLAGMYISSKVPTN